MWSLAFLETLSLLKFFCSSGVYHQSPVYSQKGREEACNKFRAVFYASDNHSETVKTLVVLVFTSTFKRTCVPYNCQKNTDSTRYHLIPIKSTAQLEHSQLVECRKHSHTDLMISSVSLLISITTPYHFSRWK